MGQENRSLREFGETRLISIIREIIGYTEDNDLEFVEVNGNKLAIKIDGLSLTTSKMPFMTFFDMGWKVMASVASDFLVKLSKPLFALVSITLRSNTSLSEFKELIRGLKESAMYFGINYIGGDLNEGNDDVIDVAAVGIPLTNAIGRRPRIGDLLVTKPLFGYTGLVFKLYYSNELGRWMDLDIVKRGINILKRPEPPIEILNDLLQYKDCISASMDSSDGLGKVLWTLAINGDVRIRVHKLPIDHELANSINALPNVNIEEVVFNGGEEFLPIFSIDRACIDDFRKFGFEEFATVEDRGGSVYYGDSVLRYRGWDYFSGWTGP
ncbi:MAG: thiamine-phosphate kinase [Vulcanisaeta sp.]